ncbi:MULTISPECIES: ABC transporter permease subunit [Leisingera]|jgi:putrescine transport system permease protein|uniref:ABC transporter permease subunit n=1 Tax=Leisingera aquaemixtae TaxID=1396826 RepID=A0ABY5WQR4_9RHOB|nr:MULTISPECIES: ABC transporter permease subunit [Leisingera]QDI78180.1 ABC transporter permease subunit [Leisingera aquaemixtae]UWQ43845.1 ABC transporter permease subunit [Leisingera aquaemixtae]
MSTSAPRRLLILLPYLWLGLFFLVPFLIVIKIALSDSVTASPPYAPTFSLDEGLAGLRAAFAALDFENFLWLAEDGIYLKAYLNSVKVAAIATLLCLMIGYPVAYAMAKAPQEWRKTLLLLVILPFWTSFLIRIYAWIGILKNEGFLNLTLMKLGLIDQPLAIMHTEIAVYVGIVYSYLPFMILPLYASLERIDGRLLEAAEDLGCGAFAAFRQITLPLSLPGVVAGCFLVFIPAIGEFVIPDLLGGSGTLMIGKTLWLEFFSNRDWGVAAAVAIVLLTILIVPIVLFQRHQQKHQEELG